MRSATFCVCADFNPRSREGSDRQDPGELPLQPHFNPRSREGSDFLLRLVTGLIIEFQSTLPRRERRLLRSRTVFPPLFQSTLPRRERRACRRPRPDSYYFNPRSREGSDVLVAVLDRTHIISIHAPAKGATPSSDFRIRFYDISIHAPAKGATYYWDNSQMSVKFQSTLPRRERLDNIALTRLGWYFNPRSREGSDALFPVGGFVFDHFNPRSREGSDPCAPSCI